MYGSGGIESNFLNSLITSVSTLAGPAPNSTILFIPLVDFIEVQFVFLILSLANKYRGNNGSFFIVFFPEISFSYLYCGRKILIFCCPNSLAALPSCENLVWSKYQ